MFVYQRVYNAICGYLYRDNDAKWWSIMDDANVLGSPAPAENRGGRWILEISGSNRTVVGFQKSDTILQGPTFMVVPRLYFPTQLEFFFPLQSPRWTKNFLFFFGSVGRGTTRIGLFLEWLVVWNMAFICPYIGKFVTPTDDAWMIPVDPIVDQSRHVYSEGPNKECSTFSMLVDGLEGYPLVI